MYPPDGDDGLEVTHPLSGTCNQPKTVQRGRGFLVGKK